MLNRKSHAPQVILNSGAEAGNLLGRRTPATGRV